MFRFALLSVAVLSSGAPLPKQFDLACSGDYSAKGKYGLTKEGWSEQFRIDLAKGKWCRSACTGLTDFADIDEGRLTLSKETSARYDSETWIERTSGKYFSQTMFTDGGWAFTTGQCEKAAFSGFPKVEQKF